VVSHKIRILLEVDGLCCESSQPFATIATENGKRVRIRFKKFLNDS
jgi:hypothetical protein